MTKCIVVFADGHTEERDGGEGLYLVEVCVCGGRRYFKGELASNAQTKGEANPRGTNEGCLVYIEVPNMERARR